MDNCEYRLSEWMLERRKEFEEARWKTARERGTVDIVKTKISVIGGALDEADARDCWTDGIIRRWKK